MRLTSTIASALTAICSLSTLVHGHSKRREPLNYLSMVDQPVIHTPSHRVHAYSDFDITFSLHRGEQRIRLKLEPNHDAIAEGAFVSYVDANGRETRREPIDRMAHKVFKGTSWREVRGHKGHWERAGDASVSVYRDGDTPLFEGAFGLGLDDHTIQLRSQYQSTKHESDVDLEPSSDDYMLVWRNEDISSKVEQQQSLEISPLYTHIYQPWEQELRRKSELPEFDRDITVRSDARSWGTMNVRHLFGKRQQSIDGSGNGGNQGIINLRQSIGNTAGCPKQKQVALMGVAADCTYVSAFNGSDAVRSNIINQVNTASKVYESTFNVTLGIANLTITDAQCPSSAAAATPWNVGCGPLDVQGRLTAFSGWRGQQNDQNAFWTLLSNCPTGDEVGLSWTGALCTRKTDANNGTGANIVVKTSTEWQVIAHEVAHTFGAVHDCDSSACANTNFVNSQQCCPVSSSGCDAQGQFIMNPSISSGSINRFSPCTIGNICGGFQTKAVNSTCLKSNVNVPLITQQQCGNGIVEPGEDCDCGGTQNCGTNNCCDPTTCKFKSGAQCDDSNQSCCKECKFAAAGSVCRASTGQCDPQETCPGNNGTCPPDNFAPDGQDCGSDLQCASGQCTSRSLQCRQLMGTSLTNGRNDTYACDSSSCRVSCASPEFGNNVCYQMNQNLLDGTTCGGNGHCKNGECEGSTTGGQIESWISENKNLVIGIACGVGGLLILSIICCIISTCRRKRRIKRAKKTQAAGWNGSNYSAAPPQGQGPWPVPQSSTHPQQPWYAQDHGYQMQQMGGAHYAPGQSVRYA